MAGHDGGRGAQRPAGRRRASPPGPSTSRRDGGTDMTMLPPNALAEADELDQPAIRTALDRLDARTRLVWPATSLGFWDADGRPGRAPGRQGAAAGLALLSARAAGRRRRRACRPRWRWSWCTTSRCCTTTSSTATRERRHRPTAWAVFGIRPAILAGDALLGLADEVMLRGRGRGRPGVAAPALARHGRADRRPGRGPGVRAPPRRHPRRVPDHGPDKTAALLACSATLGAVLAARHRRSRLVARTGDGSAWPSSSTTCSASGANCAVIGKPVLAAPAGAGEEVGSRWSAPSRSGRPAGKQLAELYASPEPPRTDLTLAATLVEEAGARDWTENRPTGSSPPRWPSWTTSPRSTRQRRRRRRPTPTWGDRARS